MPAVIPHRRLLEARYRRERERLHQEHRDEILDGGPGSGERITRLIWEQGLVEQALQKLRRREGKDEDE